MVNLNVLTISAVINNEQIFSSVISYVEYVSTLYEYGLQRPTFSISSPTKKISQNRKCNSTLHPEQHKIRSSLNDVRLTGAIYFEF